MTNCDRLPPRPLLLMVAGAKGAVATTLAAAVAALRDPSLKVLDSLTTGGRFSFLGDPTQVHMAGWDADPAGMDDRIATHGVLAESLWRPLLDRIAGFPIRPCPDSAGPLEDQVRRLTADIHAFRKPHPGALPVFVNLLPACGQFDLAACTNLAMLDSATAACRFPDIAYVMAAIQCGVPVVNFTPNAVEIPMVRDAAEAYGVPLAGRDGKTGQTYFKLVLASAFKARGLYVDGWYSLNILGNADGRNLMDPSRAAGKMSNKTQLLDDILGYGVGERYGEPAHKVQIDFYPPRGDAKEAWDVIDFKGLFGLPMSIRLNLQGRDSILAAPMVLDLARWVTALHLAGRSGPIPDLGFFFKKSVGDNPPVTFQDQVAALDALERECKAKMAAMLGGN